MPYVAKNGPAAGDDTAEEAWDAIMGIARDNGLIVQAYGGVATLAIPREQRSAGVRERVLRMGMWELEEGMDGG